MIPRRFFLHIALGVTLWIVVVFIYSPLDLSFTKNIQIPHANHPQHSATPPAKLPIEELEDDLEGNAPEYTPEPTAQSTSKSISHPTAGATPLPSAQSLDPPFNGAFERFPRLSELSSQQRRLSVILVWIGDDYLDYLRHILHGIQLNADSIDLLFVNRKTAVKTKCLDFEANKLNVTWGGNIKVVCMEDAEWTRRHVDVLCGKEYGWDCNSTEYDEVTKEFTSRTDKKSCNWRPIRGWVFRDLLAHPKNPFWAWIDPDVIPGNFKRYPFNLLSQLSFLTGDSSTPGSFFMLMGQFTAFNFDDPALATAWKKFPQMKTPAHFTKYIDGKFPNEPEEKYWSHGYMPSNAGLPGDDLSWGIYPDIHGDDFFDSKWAKVNASETYVISGRDILLVNTSYTREEIETLIHIERAEPIDDLGGVGWTTGEGAIVTEDILKTNCSTTNSRLKNCVDRHPLTISDPPVFRPSWIRFKDQAPNTMWRRLERDTRPRGYERKLFRHHLWSKKNDWWEFPPFEITDDLVYRYNLDQSEVWRMGATRNKTLWYRKPGETPIG
ncbi:hypothetical protein BDV96DRAFT_591541 [Lophiotrema nucula]|uniref:Uncharacterized protein n=1 Tax=Lophiotrema nucula TaxID=690887 RepID=A0A6A5YHF8_9PLEO|nr:hypothetical protein BDV96DRAFT_591541 [Lophiotrema nucula]